MEIIREDAFHDAMTLEVLPYLAKWRTEGYFTASDGKELYYETYHTDALPVRGIAVLIHGFSESVDKFYENVYYFMKLGYDVFLPELRGHGKSFRYVDDRSKVHVPDYRLFVSDLDDLMTKKVIPTNTDGLPYILFAHSMGGAISGLYLEEHPGVFAKAVFSSPMMALNGKPIPVWVQNAVESVFCLAGKGTDYAAGMKPYDGSETFETGFSNSPSRWAYHHERIAQDPLSQTCGATWRMGREMVRMTKAVRRESACARVRTPVLLFSAGNDTLVSGEGQKEFIRKIPRGRILTLDGCKHELYMADEKSLSEYWNAIEAFLAE